MFFPGKIIPKYSPCIPVSEYGKLVEFLNRRQPDWKLPLVQIVLDWAAGLTFILEICAICVFLAEELGGSSSTACPA